MSQQSVAAINPTLRLREPRAATKNTTTEASAHDTVLSSLSSTTFVPITAAIGRVQVGLERQRVGRSAEHHGEVSADDLEALDAGVRLVRGERARRRSQHQPAHDDAGQRDERDEEQPDDRPPAWIDPSCTTGLRTRTSSPAIDAA